MTNKSKIVFFLLAAVSAIFFGLTSLILVNLVGEHYIYLLSLPILFVIGLVFLVDRYLFFTLIVLTRASLDMPLQAIKLGSFGLGAILNAAVILIAVLMYIEKPPKLDFKLDGIKRAWGIFLGLSLISVAYAPQFVPSLKVLLIFVSYAAMLYLGVAVVTTQQEFARWMKFIVLSSVFPVAYGLFCLAFGGPGLRLSLGEGLRVQSTFSHPNALAFYLVLITSVCFYIYKSKQEANFSKLFVKSMPAYIMVLLGLIVMTKTRSAWVATYIFFLMYSFLYNRKYLWLAIAAPFLALLIPDVQDRLLDLQRGNDFGPSGYTQLNSYAWRKLLWSNAIKWMSTIRYIFGYGISSFIHYSTDFGMANAFQKQKFDINAHSVYVQLFFELGVLGILSFLYLIYSHLRVLVSVYRRNSLLVFSVIVILVEFLFVSYSDNMMDYLIFEWYFWFTVGITLSQVSIVNRVKAA